MHEVHVAVLISMVFHRQLMDLLSQEPRAASSLARELGLRRGRCPVYKGSRLFEPMLAIRLD